MATTITDLISSTIRTLEEGIRYHKDVEDDNGLREAFHEAGRGLLPVNQTLQAAQRNSVREPQSAMNPLRVCNTKANISASIFEAVAQAPETSRFEGYKEAVRQEGKGQKVEVLVVKRLHEAIKKLFEMEPSLPKEESGHNFTHFGTGDQYNAPSGTQNINKGSGHQVTGGSPPPAPNLPIQR
ncbi:hypothetical protein IL306_008315 [Fusarium sp. DS 682]|nr:hypothetical protein IL306_008315 [Fusarium sp. DS 682]